MNTAGPCVAVKDCLGSRDAWTRRGSEVSPARMMRAGVTHAHAAPCSSTPTPPRCGSNVQIMLVVRTEVSPQERMGATETNCTRIVAIDAWDSLGYRGCGREEHSGEQGAEEPDDLLMELADNRAEQLRTLGH